MPTAGVHLVVGASGGLGSALVAELVRRRLPVRALVRDEARLHAKLPGLRAASGGRGTSIEVLVGNVLDERSLRDATRGVSVIYHAVNYPYSTWSPAMEHAAVAVANAAGSVGATMVLPTCVLPLMGAPQPLDETAPLQPQGELPEAAARLERRVQETVEVTGKARVLNLRAGWFFGPTVRNEFVDAIFGNASRGDPMRTLGPLEVPITLAYVPDLASAMVDLAGATARSRPGYHALHFPGFSVNSQRTFLTAVATAAGRADLPAKSMPWWQVKAAGLLNKDARALHAMRHVWDTPPRLVSRRFAALLPEFSPTPIDLALQETVRSYRAK